MALNCSLEVFKIEDPGNLARVFLMLLSIVAG
jgi:hypothetical protein